MQELTPRSGSSSSLAMHYTSTLYPKGEHLYKHKRSFSLPSEADLNFDNCRANKDHRPCIKHFPTISPGCCSMREHNHQEEPTAILNVPTCRHTKNVNTYSRTAPVWIQYSRIKGNLCHSGQGASEQSSGIQSFLPRTEAQVRITCPRVCSQLS